MEIIKKRSGEWWFFTILPLFVFGMITFLLRGQEKVDLGLIIIQQTYFYVLILSSTDIGLRIKISKDLEENGLKNGWIDLLVLIPSIILFTVSYVNREIFVLHSTLFTISAVILGLGSILISNHNEFSGIPDYGKLRRSQRGGFSQDVGKMKGKYKGVETD